MILNPFLKGFNSLYKSFLFKSEFNFKHKFIQWHFNASSEISWSLCKKVKVALWFVYNSKCLLCHLSLDLQWQENIGFQIAFLVINWFTGKFIWNYSSFPLEATIWNLISISRCIDLCFLILQQISKPEILNSLKNSSNSLLRIMSLFMLSKEFWFQYRYVCMEVQGSSFCNNLLKCLLAEHR